MKIDFNLLLRAEEPYDAHSFLQGFVSACNLFGIYKNGTQVIGCLENPVKEIKEAVRKFTEEQE